MRRKIRIIVKSRIQIRSPLIKTGSAETEPVWQFCSILQHLDYILHFCLSVLHNRDMSVWQRYVWVKLSKIRAPILSRQLHKVGEWHFPWNCIFLVWKLLWTFLDIDYRILYPRDQNQFRRWNNFHFLKSTNVFWLKVVKLRFKMNCTSKVHI